MLCFLDLALGVGVHGHGPYISSEYGGRVSECCSERSDHGLQPILDIQDWLFCRVNSMEGYIIYSMEDQVIVEYKVCKDAGCRCVI